MKYFRELCSTIIGSALGGFGTCRGLTPLAKLPVIWLRSNIAFLIARDILNQILSSSFGSSKDSSFIVKLKFWRELQPRERKKRWTFANSKCRFCVDSSTFTRCRPVGLSHPMFTAVNLKNEGILRIREKKYFEKLYFWFDFTKTQNLMAYEQSQLIGTHDVL